MSQILPKLTAQYSMPGEVPNGEAANGNDLPQDASADELRIEERAPISGLGLDGADALGGGDLVGRVLCNRYLVEEVIQQAACGITCRAYHLGLDQPVLVRLVQDSHSMNGETWLIENACILKSRYLLNTLETGRSKEDWRFFVTDYPRGSTLSCLEAELERLSVRNIVAFGRQLAMALDSAHRVGVVHGALTLDDLFVGDAGESAERLLVVGFGVARTPTSSSPPVNSGIFRLRADASSEPLTGRMQGAPADVYALGAILRELVRVASRAQSTPPDAKRELKHPSGPPGTAARHAVLQGLNLIIEGCLVTAAGSEPRNAWEVARDLSKLEVVSKSLLPEASQQPTLVVHAPHPRQAMPESKLPKVVIRTDEP